MFPSPILFGPPRPGWEIHRWLIVVAQLCGGSRVVYLLVEVVVSGVSRCIVVCNGGGGRMVVGVVVVGVRSGGSRCMVVGVVVVVVVGVVVIVVVVRW